MSAISFDYQFTSVRALTDWLEKKNFDSGSPEAYDEWLQGIFDDGNSISVNGTEYDYLACRELV